MKAMSSPLPTHLSPQEKEMLVRSELNLHMCDRLESQFRAGERFRQAIGQAIWYFDDLEAVLREKVRDAR